MLHIDCARWDQTPEDLRRLATSAPHPRTRERFLALYEITQASCATRVAPHTHRHPQTVMGWVHAYNEQGPAALAYRRPFDRLRRRPPPFCPHIEAELGAVIDAARCAAAAPPIAGADPPPRWTLRRLVAWVRERFGLRCCRETIRAALRRLDLSWKKAKYLLGRADPEKRQAFVKQVQDLLDGAQRDRYLLVFWDEAHIHQETDLGYGWAPRGQRFWVTSHSPGLSAKLSFYGLYLYNEGAVRLWPYPRANGTHMIDALRRLRAALRQAQEARLADPRGLGRRLLSPRCLCEENGRRIAPRSCAAARLQPRLHARRGTLALAARRGDISLLPPHRG